MNIYTAVMIFNTSNGNYMAFIRELPHVTVQGNSIDQVKSRLNDALKYVLDYDAKTSNLN